MSRGRTNLALAALFLGTFVLSSAELLVVGLLNLIAADLPSGSMRVAQQFLAALARDWGGPLAVLRSHLE